MQVCEVILEKNPPYFTKWSTTFYFLCLSKFLKWFTRGLKSLTWETCPICSLIPNNVLLGWGHLWPQELYLHKVESPCPKVILHTKYQCIQAIGLWEEYFSYTLVAIFWQILFLCANFTNHVSMMLHMKFIYIWIIDSWEEEVYMYFPI